MTQQLLLLHTSITWALAGLIWTIQRVHYPLFEHVGEEKFPVYHARHMWLVTWVVGPLALAEGGTAALLFWQGERSPLFWVSLAALGVAWISTFCFQVPLHGRLSGGFDLPTIRRLTSTNWMRTIAWTVRGVCLLLLLWPVKH